MAYQFLHATREIRNIYSYWKLEIQKQEKSYSFDVSDLDEGEYFIEVSAQDMAKNSVLSKIIFEIDHSVVDPPKTSISTISPEMVGSDQNYLLAIIIGVIAIAIVSVLVILKQKSKVTPKNWNKVYNQFVKIWT